MRLDWQQIRTTAARDLEALALSLYLHQFEGNLTYRGYVEAIGRSTSSPVAIDQIPFLPIQFFKENLVVTGDFTPQVVFESSGTTGVIPSRHAIRDLSIYQDQLLTNFERVYGSVSDWCILALLPSYLERKNASLVYMMQQLIGAGKHPDSGFYLNEWELLIDQLIKGEESGRKTMLVGVGFALLDLAEKFRYQLSSTTILETGGMKGRRKEWVREELHDFLSAHFQCGPIHSEYGMTELLSQAYSVGDGVFECPPWMRVMIREEEDPLAIKYNGRGLLNIIDLANIHSCAFIATDDIGEVYPDGRFRVLGRRDGSEMRGCSLLVTG